MKATVLVPTYRRPRDLERCLSALGRQTEPADEVLLVVRESDDETLRLLQRLGTEGGSVRRIPVAEPGVVAALNNGLEEVRGDFVAFLDDDAAPHPHWLARIGHHFEADPTVGGVGGRDYVFLNGELYEGGGRGRVVGKVQWFGRVIGNHHRGSGGPRSVDVLKGANMSFRREAIEGLRLDRRLRGQGAQVDWELALCLQVKRRGWRLIYDPAVSIDHFPADRHDYDRRNSFSAAAVADASHNATLVLLEHLSPLGRVAFWAVTVVVGTRTAPGLLQFARLALQRDGTAGARLAAALRGRWDGWNTWRHSRRATSHQPER